MFYRNASGKGFPVKLAMVSTIAALTLAGCGGGGGSSDRDKNRDRSSGKETIPTISIEPVSVNEGNRGDSELKIPIRLSGPSSKDIEMSYSFEDGTAINGDDYSATSGTLLIPAGARRADIVVILHGDIVHEPDETFTVFIDSADNATLDRQRSAATVTIVNDDSPPTVGFAADQQSVVENVGRASVPLVLSAASGFPISVTTTLEGTAQLGGDYILNGGDVVTFAPGETLKTLDLSIIQDDIPEGGETIIVSLANIKNASPARGEPVHTILILGDIALNDTGLRHYSDGSIATLAFEPASHPGQDASFGRDARPFEVDDDGHAGFSFTKLDESGNPLPSASAAWRCTLDNATGLVWENKHADFDFSFGMAPVGEEWRSGNFVYAWHKDIRTDNGGSSGALRSRDNRLDKKHPVRRDVCGYKSEDARKGDLYCDTKAYVDEMNFWGVCGFNDWRMPEPSELRSIANYDRPDGTVRPDPRFFSNIKANIDYYSSAPAADNEASAWCFSYLDGTLQLCQKGIYEGFIAVRNKQ